MAAPGDPDLRRLGLATSAPGLLIAASAGGALAGLAFTLSIEKAGALGALVPALLLGGIILLRFPGVAVALLVGLSVLIEPVDPGFLPTEQRLYEPLGHVITPIDVFLYLALGGLLLRFALEGRRPDPPRPLGPPLILLGCAIFAGIVTAYAAHAGVPKGELYHRGLTMAYLGLVPFLVVNVVRDTRVLRICLVAAAALAVFKGASGLYTVFGSGGLELEGETVSYLEPAANLAMLAFLLGVAAAAIRGVKLPGWMLAGTPIVLLSLLFSYRRSFWIAAVLGLVAVAFIASRNHGRILYAVAILASIFGLAVAAAAVSGTSNAALTERIATLDPTSEDTKRGDEYRNDERKNVLASLSEHPFTGIGLGVEWRVRYPLAEVHARNYVHFAFLYFWLQLGPLGALAYVMLLAAALWLASRIWRFHPDPVVQVGAIAAFATFIGIAVIELTATFSGVDPRWSIMVGAMLGWLVASWRDLPADVPRRGPLESALT